MKILGLTHIMAHGSGPVAILEQNATHFVGAFCSGDSGENLTVKTFKNSDIYPHCVWKNGPLVDRLRGKIESLPQDNQKIAKMRKKLWMLTIRSDANMTQT